MRFLLDVRFLRDVQKPPDLMVLPSVYSQNKTTPVVSARGYDLQGW